MGGRWSLVFWFHRDTHRIGYRMELGFQGHVCIRMYVEEATTLTSPPRFCDFHENWSKACSVHCVSLQVCAVQSEGYTTILAAEIWRTAACIILILTSIPIPENYVCDEFCWLLPFTAHF
jgi:hypothetical protein